MYAGVRCLAVDNMYIIYEIYVKSRHIVHIYTRAEKIERRIKSGCAYVSCHMRKERIVPRVARYVQEVKHKQEKAITHCTAYSSVLVILTKTGRKQKSVIRHLHYILPMYIHNSVTLIDVYIIYVTFRKVGCTYRCNSYFSLCLCVAVVSMRVCACAIPH